MTVNSNIHNKCAQVVDYVYLICFKGRLANILFI